MAINKVGTKGIKDGAISAIDFADNTITSGKLVNSAITNALLSNSSITLGGTSIALGASVSFTNNFVQWQSVITADGSTFNTAVAGKGYFINTTSAVHTINLPASASIGDFVAIKDYAGTFVTYNLTIGRNGHNIQGVANDSLISTNRASLVLVYVDATKGWLYWEEHNVGDLENAGYIAATGGTVTTSGDFKIHSFTGDGCFVVSCVGFPSPAGLDKIDYLVVAGGGSGGTNQSGGGGAGGYRESKDSTLNSPHTASPLAVTTGITVTSTTYPVTVGGGAAPGTAPNACGSAGSNSVFSTITSAGGGKGTTVATSAPGSPPTGGYGGAGGSGGGGSGAYYKITAGGAGNTPPVSPPQGQPGGGNPGPAASTPSNTQSGGGGGAGTAGSNGIVSPATAGVGGNGVASSITGSSVTRAGGGGGSASGLTGAGGTGGGGAGAASGSATAGTTNTGGGGGGQDDNSGNGGAGGSGIVIIRYKFQ